VDSADSDIAMDCIYKQKNCGLYDFDLNCDGTLSMADVTVFTNASGKNDSDIPGCKNLGQ